MIDNLSNLHLIDIMFTIYKNVIENNKQSIISENY
jgi:hypothetical protein